MKTVAVGIMPWLLVRIRPGAPETFMTKPRTARRLLPVLLVILVVCIGALLKLRYVWPGSSTRQLAPGLRLITSQYNRPWGAARIYEVHAAPRDGWRLGIVPAGSNVLEADLTTYLASRVRALVAVNGGYFAYGGAAVGPLRIQGEWIRLPWKNRTTLGLKPDGSHKIDNLAARATLVFSDGTRLPVHNLNGYPAADGVTVLTSHFPDYTLKPGEIALVLPASGSGLPARKVGGGHLSIAGSALAVIGAGGAAPQVMTVSPAVRSARLEVALSPADWEAYPDILGAGPRLVQGGRIHTTEQAEEFKPDVLKRGPRTALGFGSDGALIVMVADGRQMPFEGLTIPEAAQVMQQAGAVDALSLDGGNSATLVVDHQVINRPSAGSEVQVANAVVLEHPLPPGAVRRGH